MAMQSTIHHMLAILAGDVAPSPDEDAVVGSLARLVGRLGLSGLTRDTLETGAVREATPWFVRVTFPGIAPPDAFIVSLATAAGLQVESLAPSSALGPTRHGATEGRHCRWLLIGPQSRDAMSSAVAHLRATHRIHAVPFRQIEGR